MTNTKTVLKDYILGLAHIGHVVENMDEALAGFKRVYGLSDEDIFIPDTPPGQPILTKFAFIRVGNTEFELIEPVSAHFKTLLLDMPSGHGGINHVAYIVSDIEQALTVLAANGSVPGHVTPDGIVDMGRKKMVYLDPATTDDLLIELIEIVER